MFDVGFSELVLIGLIALIVLGPERLPEVARSAGRWVAKIRRFVENVKRDIDQEIKGEDLSAFKQMHAELSETRNLLQKSAAETFNSLSNSATSVQQTGATDADRPALPAPESPVPSVVPARPKKPGKAGKSTTKTPVAARPVKKSATPKTVRSKTHRTPHGGRKKTRSGG